MVRESSSRVADSTFVSIDILYATQRFFLQADFRSRPQRILVFNCTSGRSGPTFLGSMLARAAEQLKIHKCEENALALFDHVIFCTNVTYASGKFKGGTYIVVFTVSQL